MPRSASARCAALLMAGSTLLRPAVADDPIVTNAMKASTIVEVFVEERGIRVELEIGTRDLRAFGNALPDDLYRRLGLPAAPASERVSAFFAQDWVTRTAAQAPLAGRIVRTEARYRVVRDPVTGAPVAVPGQGEPVVFIELQYDLAERPAQLGWRAPVREGSRVPAANVGFVVYHRGVPVNDFRYLGGEETLDLDWDDPWFSRFRNRNLRRRFDAPISAFLYVDHFEVRQEVVVRPRDLQRWIDLGLGDAESIDVARQEDIKRAIVAFLAERNPVEIDGRRVEPQLGRVHFLRRTLRQTGVIDPPEPLDLLTATLGVIFVYPIDRLPQRVTLQWELFHDKYPAVPAVATDEAGGLPATLTAEDPTLEWQNFLTNPVVPAPQAVMAPPGETTLRLPLASLACAGLAFGLWRARRRGRRTRQLAVGAAIALVGAVLCWPVARVAVPVPLAGRPALAAQDTREVLGALLYNVYRAFDRRDESAVYDALSKSVAGDLLSDIYLETRRSLELEQQGGAQAQVKDVEMLEAVASPVADGDGFRATGSWTVTGSVGHWGHIHERRNRYEARFVVMVIDNAWRIASLEVVNEERL